MKIAIVLHGHVRTWEFCKDNIVNTINKIYKNFDIDWMIGFWKTSTVYDAFEFLKSKHQNVVIMETFDNTTLFSQRTDSHGYSIPSCVGRWYIRQKLGIKRRYIEIKNNIKYEIVVYIRPDVCFIPQSENPYELYNQFYLMLCNDELTRKQYQLQAGGDYRDHWIFSQVLREVGMDDMYTTAGSLTADIFDHCYLEFNDSTSNLETYKLGFGEGKLPTAAYFHRHSITSPHINDRLLPNISPVIIRPHAVKEDFLTKKPSQYEYVSQWQHFDYETKKKWCLDCGIDLIEYGLTA